MKAELQQLVALQTLDTRIRTLEKDLEAIPERRAEIEREFDQRAFEIRGLENRRDEAKHTRARLENDVVEQKGRAERAERNLMSSKKQDEYTAAIREADAARKQISTLETQILEQHLADAHRPGPFQVARRQDLVGVEVGLIDRTGRGGELAELVHDVRPSARRAAAAHPPGAH